MEKLKIYTEVSFLDYLFELAAKRSEIELETPIYADQIGMLIRLLESRVVLFLDCSSDEFKKKTVNNPYYKYLLKKTGVSQLELVFETKLKNLDLPGDYLFLLSSVSEDFAMKCLQDNIMVCTMENLKEHLPKLFINRAKYISKNEEMEKFYEDFIDEAVPETHNFVFNDNYILTNSYARESIVHWVNELTANKSRLVSLIVISKKLESIKLKEHFEKLNKRLSPKFTAFQCQLVIGDIHNRHILTDHYWITCGHNLELFRNGKAKGNDEIALKSKFLPKQDHKSDSGFEQYNKIRNELKLEYQKKIRLESSEPLYFGTCDSKILK